MSQPQYCAACRVAPAAIFCSADAALLCAACDVLVHDANKLARRHARVPLHLIDTLQLALPQHNNRPSAFLAQSPDRSTSVDAPFDDSDESSGFLVPDTDDIPDFHVPPTFTLDPPYSKPSPAEHPLWEPLYSPPTVPDTDHGQLASIAGAFVKKEAQTLFESTRSVDSGLVKGLEMPFVKEPLPPLVENSLYSSPEEPRHFIEEQQVLPGSRFGLPEDHIQPVFKDILGSSLTTEDDSSSAPKTERKSLDDLERSDEQKRLDRQAALTRFRHKRANRSFRKKVRYACRKQLAESRPRVKGRFVGRAKPTPSGRIQKAGTAETTGG